MGEEKEKRGDRQRELAQLGMGLLDVLDNRLLSIRCDINKNRICFNACVDGEWGKEGAIKQHYKVNDEFDLRIRCFDDQFHSTTCEHRLVAKFAHYVPMNNISHVYVNGDVLLYGVSVYRMQLISQATSIRVGDYSCLVWYPKGAKEFLIDFHANGELACRIKAAFPTKKVLRTSRLNDRWGPEERIGADQGFPFKRKQTFDLLIYCSENKFEMLVNDCPFATFDQRIPCNQINKLSIEGDISLLGVHLK
ncbi:galactoside-binding lectin [Cooperia oncophora]